MAKSNRMKLPSAYIVGPMRSGTTWIYEYLKSRNDISLANGVKEPQFFNLHYSKGVDWYLSHYEENELYTVEVNASYFHYKDSPQRMRDLVGVVPIIAIKRDPVDRSYSHFRHLARYGRVSEDIYEAVEKYPDIITASYFDKHVNNWKAVFGEDNVHQIDFALIAAQPEKFLRLVCQYIGIEYVQTEFEIFNKVNEGKIVKGKLNKITAPLASALRKNKAYGIINFAKQLGLKKIVYGGKDIQEDPSIAKTKAVIKQMLQNESIQ